MLNPGRLPPTAWTVTRTIMAVDTYLSVDVRGAIAVVTLDKGDGMNALGHAGDGAVFSQLCDELNTNRSLRCAILTGKGWAFSAGGDLRAMDEKSGLFAGDAPQIRNNYRRDVHAIVRALDGLDIPLIAAVNGPAVGLGCDVACLADMRIAGRSARFGVTFLRAGLVPGDGGAWLLPRLIGMARAAELLFTGTVIDAQTALDWGLVNDVVDDDALMDAAMALAAKVAQQPPDVLRFTKMLLRRGREASFEDIRELSAALQAHAHKSAHHEEAVRAFLEKRQPEFKDP